MTRVLGDSAAMGQFLHSLLEFTYLQYINIHCAYDTRNLKQEAQDITAINIYRLCSHISQY